MLVKLILVIYSIKKDALNKCLNKQNITVETEKSVG